MSCKNCSHFRPGDLGSLGVCGVRLPPWLFSDAVDRTVRADDGCDLILVEQEDMTKEDYEAIYGWGGQQ